MARFRKRQNFIGGQLDAELTTSGLEMSSPGLSSLEAVSSDEYMPIVLDPDGYHGSPEIVYIHAHTAGASTATLADDGSATPVREAKEGTTARTHPKDTYWAHAFTERDFNLATHAVERNTDTSTAYTLVLGDAGLVVEINESSASTVTVPTEASVAFPDGTVIEIARIGSGTVTISGDTGVTVNSPGGANEISSQYGSVSLRKQTGDSWVMVGDLV